MAVYAALSVLAVLEVVQSFTPYCSIETNETSSCIISEIEDDDLLFFPASEFALNRSYVNVTQGYVNASFSFSTYKETVWELLVYVDEKVESIWIIQSMDCSNLKQVPPKGTVQVHFLPVPDNFSHLILKILKQETDTLCKESMHSEDYGDDNIFEFENKQPGFYCVRVYPENSCMGNDCCTFATNATYLPGKKIKSHELPVLPDSTKKPKDMILMILCLAMAVVFIISFIKIKSIPRMSGDVECLTAEGALFISRSLPSYTTLDVQRYSPVRIATTNTYCLKNVETFLLYSRQSDAFLEQMNAFRKRLQRDRMVVYDLNSAELEEQINRDSVAWIEKMLNNNNMKYILVEHKEAVIRYTEWIENKKVVDTDYREPHHLDELFLYALSSIHNRFFEDNCIAHDYRRLFVVNFQDENEMSYKYTSLVPFKRYCLNNNGENDHYRQLIQDLSIKVRSSSESIL